MNGPVIPRVNMSKWDFQMAEYLLAASIGRQDDFSGLLVRESMIELGLEHRLICSGYHYLQETDRWVYDYKGTK